MSRKQAIVNHSTINMFQSLFKDQYPNVTEKITCFKGCSHCCYLPVHVIDDEADILIDHYHRFNLDKKDRLKDQASWGPKKKNWHGKMREQRECVFLKHGKCSVYEFRPMTCRKLLVASTEKECEESVFDHTKVTKNLNIKPIDELVDKVFKENKPKTLSESLLERL